jgi:putative FmdB family regulatory protein
MPTYDYRCDNCGHELEVFQSMTDERLTECPACGKSKLRRLIGSGSGIIFKGSGFYETDYKRSRSSTGKSPGRKPEKKPEKKPDD